MQYVTHRKRKQQKIIKGDIKILAYLTTHCSLVNIFISPNNNITAENI